MPSGGGELAASTTVAASLKKGESAFLRNFEVGSRKAQLLEGPILLHCLHAMTGCARSHSDSSFRRKPRKALNNLSKGLCEIADPITVQAHVAQVQLDEGAVRPQGLRAELRTSRFGFGFECSGEAKDWGGRFSESDPRSSQSSKASAKALTPATSTWLRLRATSVVLDCKAKAWSASLSFHSDASVHRQLAAGLNDLAAALLKVELPKLDLLQDLWGSARAATGGCMPHG